MWEVVLTGRHAVVVGDCKEQQLSPTGSLFSCKARDEGGTEAGYSGRKPIYPVALNRFNIFSIFCFLVSHLQFFFGFWSVFRGSSLLAEMAGGAGSVLGRTAAPAVCKSEGQEGKDHCSGTQRERWTLLPCLCLLICFAKKSW